VHDPPWRSYYINICFEEQSDEVEFDGGREVDSESDDVVEDAILMASLDPASAADYLRAAALVQRRREELREQAEQRRFVNSQKRVADYLKRQAEFEE